MFDRVRHPELIDRGLKGSSEDGVQALHVRRESKI